MAWDRLTKASPEEVVRGVAEKDDGKDKPKKDKSGAKAEEITVRKIENGYIANVRFPYGGEGDARKPIDRHISEVSELSALVEEYF